MKKYSDNEELNNKLRTAIKKMSDYVATTMGPRGQNVILQQVNKNPIITKDGVTVSRFMDFEDPFMSAAAHIIKQAAEKTNTEAGDGTTTSTVLAAGIFEKAQKSLIAGASPVELKRGMDAAVNEIVGVGISEASQEVSSIDDLRHIATISANNDSRIGNMIVEALEMIGKDGAISIKESGGRQTELEVVEGFKLRSGLAAGIFATNERTGTLFYERPLFLIINEKIDTIQTLMPALELAIRAKQPLVIVAEEVSGQALAACIANASRGTAQVAVVKAPGYGEERSQMLADLAVAVGARLFDKQLGYDVEEIQMSDFGEAASIESNKMQTTVMGGKCDVELMKNRVESLRSEIEQTEDIIECEKLQERIARLSSGVCVIHIGGNTEVEMIETKHRIEDALEAVNSAQEEGILPGGGSALLYALKNVDLDALEVQLGEVHEDQATGLRIIREVCEIPMRKIAENAGISADVVVERFQTQCNHDMFQGIDMRNGEIVEMFEAGIVDPAKVTRVALENAVSVAGTLINTKHAIIEVNNG